MSLSNVLNVREVATTPTSMDAITRPVMIQTTAKNLAHTPTGTLSPYLMSEHKTPNVQFEEFNNIYGHEHHQYLASHRLTNPNQYCQVP